MAWQMGAQRDGWNHQTKHVEFHGINKKPCGICGIQKKNMMFRRK